MVRKGSQEDLGATACSLDLGAGGEEKNVLQLSLLGCWSDKQFKKEEEEEKGEGRGGERRRGESPLDQSDIFFGISFIGVRKERKGGRKEGRKEAESKRRAGEEEIQESP